MTYAAVQFISYEIYTGPGQNPKRYVGLDDDQDDINARVVFMREALNAAKASNSINKDPSVLKIFMAPEFYFRGARGAYPIDLVVGTGSGPDQRALVTQLTDLIRDPVWADWMVVFGTIVARSTRSSGRSEVYNVSLVQKGSFRDETDRLTKCVLIMKEFKSDIDFLDMPPQGISHAQAAHLPAMGPGTYALEQNNPGQRGGGGYNGGSIFMLNGITFGLEVCLDHAARRLVRAWPLADDLFIQIQLIPSGGMSIKTASIATLSGGLVFNVDGLSNTQPANTYGYHTALKWVGERLPNDADLVTIPPPAGIQVNHDLETLTGLFWLPPNNNINNPVARVPNLLIYDPVPVPPSGQAT